MRKSYVRLSGALFTYFLLVSPTVARVIDISTGSDQVPQVASSPDRNIASSDSLTTPAGASTPNPFPLLPGPANPRSVPKPVKLALPYAKFDALRPQGWVQPPPLIADSILKDVGGIRTDLSDLGIGFSALTLQNLTYNLLQNDHIYHGPQLFNGQRLDLNLSDTTLTLTYDLGHIGLPGGQLEASGNITTSGLQSVNGPDNQRFATLSYNQKMFHDRVQLNIGYLSNSLYFLGLSVGGSSASLLGPQSVIPYEVGLSYGGYLSPAVTVKVNWTKEIYTRASVQRSLSVGGEREENLINPSSLRFSEPSAHPLYAAEAGYETELTDGSKFLWFRAGGIYNTTKYPSFGTDPARDNWAVYALADKQVTQPDKKLPFRGLYVGASFNYAPPGIDLYSRYFEGRVYYVAPFKNRLADLVSFVATYNQFSKSGRIVLTPPGRGNYDGTQTYIISYVCRIIPGLYVDPGLGAIVHTIVTPKLPVALESYVGLAAFF